MGPCRGAGTSTTPGAAQAPLTLLQKHYMAEEL